MQNSDKLQAEEELITRKLSIKNDNFYRTTEQGWVFEADVKTQGNIS